MSDGPQGSGSNNSKAFGSVMAVLCLIAGIYAVIEPMHLSIKSLENQLDREIKLLNKEIQDVNDALHTHEWTDAHPGARERLSEGEERDRAEREIRELEFQSLKERISNLEAQWRASLIEGGSRR